MPKLFYILILFCLGLTVLFVSLPEKSSLPEKAADKVVETHVSNENKPKKSTSAVFKKEMTENEVFYNNLKAAPTELENQRTDLSKTLGFGPVKDFRYKFKTLKRLKRDLSKSEIREVFRYLAINTTPDGDDQKEESIRNDLLEILINQSQVPRELGMFMITNFNDTNSSFIWRDYIVQHIFPYVERVHINKAQRQAVLRDWHVLSDEEELEQLIGIYQKVAAQYESTYSGTALIGLEKLCFEAGLFDQSKLSDLCESLLSKQSSHLSKTSAIQILFEINPEKSLGFAKEILLADSYKDDALVSSCLNVYIRGNQHIDETDPILTRYNHHPLFSRVIKNNLASK